jgi:ppGpp synthetase/RelA/SpoT-type nucleotidyltranferase
MCGAGNLQAERESLTPGGRELLEMYEKPEHSFNQVDKAGNCVLDKKYSRADRIKFMRIFLNFRAAHSYPLNSMYMTLLRRARKLDRRPLVAQRLKRSESIFLKLIRRGSMQLSQMQDIGGCRAVLQNVRLVNQLVHLYTVSKPVTHDLKGVRDYIKKPKPDGYRGVHLMYRFSGSATSKPWDKLRIEIQIRTRLQHSWATAVETVDTFTKEKLKTGGGSDDWQKFFQLVGSAHAILEAQPLVPNTPINREELRNEIIDLERKLQVIATLKSWSQVSKSITRRKSGADYWYLIEINPEKRSVSVESFSPEKRQTATERYAELEKQNEGSPNNVVLVSVSSVRSLQKTYPNYFADTEAFVNTLVNFLNATAGVRSS